MKIFCLNLDRATDRKIKMTEEWIDKRNFEIDFFPAFDRRLIENDMNECAYNKREAVAAGGRPLSLGEVANINSLILLYEHVLNMGYEEVILMEDDIVPYDYTTPHLMNQSIEECKKAFPHVAALIMHKPNRFTETGESRNNISLLITPPFGNLCIWLSQKAIKILIKDLKRMLFPSDWLWARRMAPLKLIAITDRPLCYHAGDDSYIQESSTDNRLYRP